MSNLFAILIALCGAVLLSVGTQLQNSGIHDSGRGDDAVREGGFSFRQLLHLVRSKRWMGGTLLLGCSVALQLISLSLAPLMVVQPVGVLGLAVTTMLTARLRHTHVSAMMASGVTMCMIGIICFVTMAAIVGRDQPTTPQRTGMVLGLFSIITAIFLVMFIVRSKELGALGYVIGAAVLYGFVSTFAKVILTSWQHNELDLLTILCAIALLLAAALGGWFVQNAHTRGAPDLVMAGLTVIDPMVGVVIGMTVLGEAGAMPGWLIGVFCVAGLLAVIGVFIIARSQRQLPSVPGPRRATDSVD